MKPTHKKESHMVDNPWKHLPWEDYEGHMEKVGQAKILRNLTKVNLERFKPSILAILGVATGNGLEHVNNKITKSVHGLDINCTYLDRIKSLYQNKIPHLHLHCCDYQTDILELPPIDLFMAFLVLEYMDWKEVVKKMRSQIKTDGVLSLVIQQSGRQSFVSKSGFRSLKRLKPLSKEIDDKELCEFAIGLGLRFAEKQVLTLTNGKKLINLQFIK